MAAVSRSTGISSRTSRRRRSRSKASWARAGAFGCISKGLWQTGRAHRPASYPNTSDPRAHALDRVEAPFAREHPVLLQAAIGRLLGGASFDDGELCEDGASGDFGGGSFRTAAPAADDARSARRCSGLSGMSTNEQHQPSERVRAAKRVARWGSPWWRACASITFSFAPSHKHALRWRTRERQRGRG